MRSGEPHPGSDELTVADKFLNVMPFVGEDLGQGGETEAQRRRGAGIVVARLRRKAGPHSQLPDERAADVVWILIDAALYRSLVTDRGWPEPEYTAWLAHSLRTQLLR